VIVDAIAGEAEVEQDVMSNMIGELRGNICVLRWKSVVNVLLETACAHYERNGD
jgi:hypothetical protein